jgi:peptidoglycan/xylan/chitin deacetylase (PgdA/CDA1 family)
LDKHGGAGVEELELPVTFFISSGFLELSPSAEAEFVGRNLRTTAQITGGLNENDVKTIVNEGFDVGGHTYNHVHLGNWMTSKK